jgi:hypothetical protein
MPRITISYRRDDSGVITGRIFDRLAAHYGRDSVFRDIDNIPPGADFRRHIYQVLDESDIILAIVGPRWVGPRANQSRLANAADAVRLEIEAALAKNKPLIPVLVLRANMPRVEQLPESLQDFAYRNAVTVDAERDFDYPINSLIRSMDRMLESVDSLAVAAIEGKYSAVGLPHEEQSKAAAKPREAIEQEAPSLSEVQAQIADYEAETTGLRHQLRAAGTPIRPKGIAAYRATVVLLALAVVGLAAVFWFVQQRQNSNAANELQSTRSAQAQVDQLSSQIKSLRDQLSAVISTKEAAEGRADQLNAQIKTLRDQVSSTAAARDAIDAKLQDQETQLLDLGKKSTASNHGRYFTEAELKDWLRVARSQLHPLDRFGLRLGEASSNGLSVLEVALNTVASQSGLRSGDLIVKADNVILKNEGDLAIILTNAITAWRKEILLQVYRPSDRKSFPVTFQFIDKWS